MCILVVRDRPLIGPLIGHFTTYSYDTRRTQDLKPVNGAKTSNATNIGQSTIGLASEHKHNIDEKQSSGASKTVAQARAHWDVCVAFSLNDTLHHMTFEHTSAPACMIQRLTSHNATPQYSNPDGRSSRSSASSPLLARAPSRAARSLFTRSRLRSRPTSPVRLRLRWLGRRRWSRCRLRWRRPTRRRRLRQRPSRRRRR